MAKKKSIIKIVFLRLFGILLFLGMVYALNYIARFITAESFTLTLEFLNDNVSKVVVMAVFFMIGELFFAFLFPANLPAPIFAAVGSSILISFILSTFSLIDRIIGTDIAYPFYKISFIIYPAVILIVIVTGYVMIFSKVFGEARAKEAEKTEKVKKPKKEGKTWKEIGENFRDMLDEMIDKIRDSLTKRK